MLSATDTEELKAKLELEKSRLETSLAEFADRDPEDKLNWKTRYPNISADGVHRDDPSDENADEVEEFDVLLETEDVLEARLRDVSRALNKFAGNSYGTCEQCGKDIPIERLRANPAALFDMEHA
ncbi:MAG: hypothetical protein A3C11_00270 [Candidatus Sungbacteria bacterium RIFCSPHIGHO2_02_FULL_49_12]|uniref:Zinc finger DksA/TraR C4-type domain-containing protein n=1 Tax=Candidatus Sungbacteria bacterium RIFCSPHIGHO2_02_FULL_49_12 TaxID=1802271 RepID=A0A1G2KTH1_9BACT|nr:MAG: hypothetical protein A3C11_00270 [Candidatus Sungbacteria bacterium RIFCSPHIGHO2_02_FULL_49_12]